MKYFLLYLLLINAAGFALMLIDKYRAKKKMWRISEATLLIVAAIGGSLGSLLGILPQTITFPIMGMSIQNIRSPQFVISLCVEIAYILVTSVIYTIYRKKDKADQ